MFPVHRSLFFTIALLVCIVAAAPLQHPLSIDNDGSHTTPWQGSQIGLQKATAAVPGEALSLASRAATTVRQLFAGFNRNAKDSSGVTQPTHFRRRVRVVRRHP